ncbi:MAG: hypothetical protein ACOX4W_05135 [Bacilli bacterium]|jgi:hypothetical protein
MKKTTKSDIINRIKSEFDSIVVPDLASDIMAKYNLRPKEANIRVVEKTKARRTIFSFKNAMSFAMLLVISLVVVLVVVNNKVGLDIGEDDPIVTQTSNVMAVESISALHMFNEDSDVEKMNFVEQLSCTLFPKGGPGTESGIEIEIDPGMGPGPGMEIDPGFSAPECPPQNDKEMAVRMHRFLILSEQMIQNKKAFKVEELESDFEEFAYKEKITIETYLGNCFEYTFYYNITNGTIEDDEYSFSGFIIYNEKKYDVIGIKKTTLEKSVLCLTVKADEKNWVEVEKNLNSEENDTEYKVYFNNQFSYETTMKLHKTDQETELRFEYRKNNFTEEFMFEKKPMKDGNGISIKHRSNNQEKEVDVYIVDQTNDQANTNTPKKRYEYRFGQDEKYQFDNPFRPKEKPRDGAQY